MRRLASFGFTLALLAFGVPESSTATATLIGETVDAIYVNFGTLGEPGSIDGTGTATVDNSIEFDAGDPNGNVMSGATGGAWHPTLVDIASTTITLTENTGPCAGPCSAFGPTEFDELILTFTGPTILDVVLEPGHGVINLTQSNVTFDAHTVSFAWFDTVWDGDESVMVTLTLVPELPLRLNVDTAADEIDANPGDGNCASSSGNCSLRAAIMETNAFPGPDEITLPAGVYTLTIPGAGEDLGATGDLDVLDDLTITGDGSALTIIDGAGIDRVIEAKSASTTIPAFVLSVEGIGITGGAGPAYGGGGVSAEGTRLELANARVYDNVGMGVNIYLGELLIEDSRIDGNVEPIWFGGGVSLGFTLAKSEIHRSTISGNEAVEGGGIYLFDAELLLNDSVVEDNSAVQGQQGGGGLGGGIRLDNSAYCEINRSLIARNSAGSGGGLFDSNISYGWLITNSTISNNTAGYGGGGAFEEGGPTCINCTITGNSASVGGGFYAGDYRGGTYEGTILAGNTASLRGNDCTGVNSEYGTEQFFSNGHNLVGDATDCPFAQAPGDIVGSSADPIDALLGPLQDNGGYTPSHALLRGSPAINALPVADCTTSEDQRGISRPQGAACDIGAYERIPPPPGPTCGIGPELVLLTPLLMLAHSRRRRVRA